MRNSIRIIPIYKSIDNFFCLRISFPYKRLLILNRLVYISDLILILIFICYNNLKVSDMEDRNKLFAGKVILVTGNH